MSVNKLFTLFIIIIVLIIRPSYQIEQFQEELYVKTLPSGHINTHFHFSTRWKLDAGETLYNTHLLPRQIAEILLQFDVKELQISLTQGLWRYETWGYPVIDSPPGAEVWAWFSSANLTEKSVDTQWRNLVNTFSGILCSSFNFIDKTNTIRPKYSFRPRFGKTNKDKQFIRYATLPRENVCTENLTPWKKLLPCNSRNGFASLLNSGFIHNTKYHSLGLSMRTICKNVNEGCVIELTETANIVYDPKLLGSSNDFSLRKLFGQGLNGACPLATSSKIYVDITDDKFELTPEPEETIQSTRGGISTMFAMYDIQKETPNKLFNIAWIKKEKIAVVPVIPLPPLFAHRYILGHGLEKGKLVTQITNTHWESLNIIVQENIPWFVPIYIHTIVIKCGNKILQPKTIHYIPGEQRERPYHLELAFTIPEKSTVELSIDFDYIFLKWQEYPPDASHGHYMGAAVISTLLPTGKNYTAIPLEGYRFEDSFNATRQSYFLRIHTESVVLSLPTPDFSMPYNVICLACTVVALAFGPIHSVATKKIVIEDKSKPKSLLGKIKKMCSRKKDSSIETDEQKSEVLKTKEETEEVKSKSE